MRAHIQYFSNHGRRAKTIMFFYIIILSLFENEYTGAFNPQTVLKVVKSNIIVYIAYNIMSLEKNNNIDNRRKK